MRTTTAAFKAAFKKGTIQPVIVARIYYRQPSSSADYYSWDVSSDTIEGMQDDQWILDQNSEGVKPVLMGITQLGQKMDPLTRNISTGDCSLQVLGLSDVFNSVVPVPTAQASDQGWFSHPVKVYLAEKSLTNPEDWLQIWHGYTHDAVSVGSNIVEFRCKNFETLFIENSFYGGTFAQERPIDVAHKILRYALTEDVIKDMELTLDGGVGTGGTFDPTSSTYTGTQSWSVSNLWGGFDRSSFYQGRASIAGDENYADGVGLSPLMDGFPGSGETKFDREMSPVLSLVNILLRPYYASVWIDGSGKIKVNAFDATIKRTFSENEYSDFEQVTGWNDSVINSVTMKIDSPDAAGGKYSYTLFNPQSRAKFGIRTREIPNFPFMRCFLWFRGQLQTLVDSGARGAILHGGGVLGMTGQSSDPDSFVPPEKGYFLYGPWPEIVSYDSLDPYDGPQIEQTDLVQYEAWYVQHNADGSPNIEILSGDLDGGGFYRVNYLKRPMFWQANVTGRDQYTTSHVELLATNTSSATQTPAKDLTQALSYANKILDRFTAGAPTAKAKVSLDNADLEIGDVVEFSKPEFAWEGYTENDSIKWEITSLTFSPLDDDPGIDLELCVAEHSPGAPWFDYTTLFTPPITFLSPIPSRPWGPRSGKIPNPSAVDGLMRRNVGILNGGQSYFKTTSDITAPSAVLIKGGVITNGASGTGMAVPSSGREGDADLFPSGAWADVSNGHLVFTRKDLEPETKYRIYFNLSAAHLMVQKQLKSSALPFTKDFSQDAAPICQFTTDLNGDPESVSLIDLRDLGTTLVKANLPNSIGGSNLDFEDWTSPDGIPDNWTVGLVEQPNAGAIARNVLTPHSGSACLEYNGNTSMSLMSGWIPIKESSFYKLTAWHNPTTLNSRVSQTEANLEYANGQKEPLGAGQTLSFSGVVVGSWYKNQTKATTPAGAFYARISVLRSGAPAPVAADSILIDDISFDLLGAPQKEQGDFIDFGDVPSDYIGEGTKAVRVNASADSVEFARLDHYCRMWSTTISTLITKLTTPAILFTNRQDPDFSASLLNSTWTAPFTGAFNFDWSFVAAIDTTPITGHWAIGGIVLQITNSTTATTLVKDNPQIRAGENFIFAGNATFDLTLGDAIYFDWEESSGFDANYYGSTNGTISKTGGSVMTITSVRTY